MTDGVVLDANVINAWYRQYLVQNGDLFQLVRLLCETVGLAADAQGKMRHEWEQQGDYLSIRDWIDDEMKVGHIRLVRCRPLDNHAKHLHIKLGLDRHSPDAVYVWCSYATRLRHILSWDIDLYDPKAKGDGAQRQLLMKERRGSVCRYLERKLAIRVCTGDQCRRLLARLSFVCFGDLESV